MDFKNIKELWLDDKLAIYNNQNKATFEALKILLPDYPLPFIYDGLEDENGDSEIVEIYKWQDLKKAAHFEYLHNDGAEFFDSDNQILQPEEVIKKFKQ